LGPTPETLAEESKAFEKQIQENDEGKGNRFEKSAGKPVKAVQETTNQQQPVYKEVDLKASCVPLSSLLPWL